MLIDVFLFHQEYDMLEFRLRLLYSHVDKFIIIEADKTFSGLEKPFNFEQYRKRYAWAEDKLLYFKLHCDTSKLNLTDKPKEFQPDHDCWKIEYAQRNAITAACSNFSDDAILIMGDVDEIPSLEAIEWARGNVRLLPVVCQQSFFYYNLKHLRQEAWLGSVFSTLRIARSLGTQGLRNRRNILTRIGNAGWHLSYFDNADGIKQKIESFSHQELNTPEFKEQKHIENCLITGRDLFKRNVPITKVTADFFPVYFKEYAQLYDWGLHKNNTNTCRVANKHKKATVSLAMIVRNEENNLPRCLASVAGLFDEIVIVDTGSTDSTKEIATKSGARVIDFIWTDDFSAARNASLENATGDYVFWMDADDVITPQERNKLETLLNALPAEPKYAYVMRCSSDPDKTNNSGQIVVDHVRLFPRMKMIKWKYRVHEQILPALTASHIPIHWTDITIRHTGYADAQAKERKRQRDWGILQKELDSLPDDPFVQYNLGMIAFERQQWQQALEYFLCSLSTTSGSSSFESIHRKLYAMIAWVYQILGNNPEALRICDEGLSVNPEDAELWFRKAVVYRYLGKTVEAKACWQHILELKRPNAFCSIDQGIYGHLTRRNLAIIAKESGNLAEAQMHLKAVLAECPGDADAIRNLELA